MSTQPKIGTDVHTFLIELGCSQGERVTVASGTGKINRSAATETRIGVATRNIAAGEFGPIRLPAAPSAIYVTDVAITPGVKVYGAAAGKVGVTNTNEPVGVAISTTTGTAGEYVEVVHVAV